MSVLFLAKHYTPKGNIFPKEDFPAQYSGTCIYLYVSKFMG